MLKQRVITALALVALLLPALAAEAAWPFALLTLIFIGAAGWEWSRLNQAPGWRAWVLAAAVVGAGLYVADRLQLPVWQAGADAATAAVAVPHVHAWGEAPVGFMVPGWVWWLAAVLWVPLTIGMLRWGSAHWLAVPQALRRFLGLVVLVLAWLALVEGRAQGLNFLLSVFCLVWAADIGAYFGGRTWGRRKLAPSISPGKSWEGVWSGLVTVLLVAGLWILADRHGIADSPSLYSRLWSGLGPLGALVALVALVAMSVTGDLVESLIKRQAGVKDSSQLLPGHGGVLDRVDALLPVLPLAMAALTLCHG